MSKDFESYNHGMPWEDGYGFCEATRVGNTIHVSGQLSHDMEANFIGEGDFELQVRTTFQNIDRILKHYGTTKEQIVGTMVYVKELRQHFDDICRLHREYFGSHRPTSTLLGVAELAFPQQLVEIAPVVVLGG